MTFTVDDIKEQAKSLLARKNNKMGIIRIKCWEQYSISRINNGNEPYSFSEFSNALDKSSYIDRIRFDMIDVSDIGGKEEAIKAIEHWFS